MKSTDQLAIQTFSIKNFRSITSMTISAERLNMLVGLNDVGKSNVLKALNLFSIARQITMRSLYLKRIFHSCFRQIARKQEKLLLK